MFAVERDSKKMVHWQKAKKNEFEIGKMSN